MLEEARSGCTTNAYARLHNTASDTKARRSLADQPSIRCNAAATGHTARELELTRTSGSTQIVHGPRRLLQQRPNHRRTEAASAELHIVHTHCHQHRQPDPKTTSTKNRTNKPAVVVKSPTVRVHRSTRHFACSERSAHTTQRIDRRNRLHRESRSVAAFRILECANLHTIASRRCRPLVDVPSCECEDAAWYFGKISSTLNRPASSQHRVCASVPTQRHTRPAQSECERRDYFVTSASGSIASAESDGAEAERHAT
jgi:hypothetical protein